MDGKFKDVLGYFWVVFRQTKGDLSSLRKWWDHGKTQIVSAAHPQCLAGHHSVYEELGDCYSGAGEDEAVIWRMGIY